MQHLWFSWIREGNMHRTGTIFWVYMCCSPARRRVTASDYLTRRPRQIVLGPVLSLQRKKRRIKNKAQTKAWTNTLHLQRSWGEEQSEKRWKTEGLFVTSLWNLFRSMLKNVGTVETLRIQGYLFPSLLLCKQWQHTCNTQSNTLLRGERSQHPLQLFATLQASSAVS